MNALPDIQYCREVLKRSGSSFALAFYLLPREQREAMTAFYAFCRLADDAVDEAPDIHQARRELEPIKRELELVFTGVPTQPVFRELQRGVRRFGIRRDHLELVIDGVEQDIDKPFYGTFDELYSYCYRVASAVGLVCVTVLGAKGKDVELYAELCGLAVQLTNIIRDVGEDAGRGRIYLPREDLESFGLDESDILEHRDLATLKKLLYFECRRAREYYLLAAAALPVRFKERLYFAEALRETYSLLLERLAVSNLDVFSAPMKLSKAVKLAVAFKHKFGSFASTGAGA